MEVWPEIKYDTYKLLFYDIKTEIPIVLYEIFEESILKKKKII